MPRPESHSPCPPIAPLPSIDDLRQRLWLDCGLAATGKGGWPQPPTAVVAVRPGYSPDTLEVELADGSCAAVSLRCLKEDARKGRGAALAERIKGDPLTLPAPCGTGIRLGEITLGTAELCRSADLTLDLRGGAYQRTFSLPGLLPIGTALLTLGRVALPLAAKHGSQCYLLDSGRYALLRPVGGLRLPRPGWAPAGRLAVIPTPLGMMELEEYDSLPALQQAVQFEVPLACLTEFAFAGCFGDLAPHTTLTLGEERFTLGALRGHGPHHEIWELEPPGARYGRNHVLIIDRAIRALLPGGVAAHFGNLPQEGLSALLLCKSQIHDLNTPWAIITYEQFTALLAALRQWQDRPSPDCADALLISGLGSSPRQEAQAIIPLLRIREPGHQFASRADLLLESVLLERVRDMRRENGHTVTHSRLRTALAGISARLDRPFAPYLGLGSGIDLSGLAQGRDDHEEGLALLREEMLVMCQTMRRMLDMNVRQDNPQAPGPAKGEAPGERAQKGKRPAARDTAVATALPPGKRQRFTLPGQPGLERAFCERILAPLEDPESYRRFGVDTLPNVLLHGRPGTGKTYAAEALATHLEQNFGFSRFSISSTTVGSPYIHESAQKIGEIFEQAHDAGQAVVLVDELESYCSSREGAPNDHHLEEVGEILRRFTPPRDGTRLLVLGMTNLIGSIDEALLRTGRFDLKIEVLPPSVEDMARLLRGELAKYAGRARLDYLGVAQQLADHPLSDLAYVSRRARAIAAAAGARSLTPRHLSLALEDLKGLACGARLATRSAPRAGFGI